MKKTLATTAILLVALGGAALAVTTFAPSLVPTDNPFSSADEHDADAPPASEAQRAIDDAPGDADPTPTGPTADTPPPLVNAPTPGASPLQMTEELLGPTPEGLRTVDPAMPLAEALRQHPSFPNEDPVTTPGIPEEGPLPNALARIVQAHAVLTELQTAANKGDDVAKDLLPYAAAQLAEEAENAGPTLDTASDIHTKRTDAELRLNGDAVPVEAAGSFQEEVNRLYGLIGLPATLVDPGVHDPTQLARLVHATANVVEATHEAQRAAERTEDLQRDIERVDQILADGALNEEEARLILEVASTVHEVTLSPIQQRLDALDTLYATSQAVLPTLEVSDTPVQEVSMPADGHEVGTIEDVIAMLTEEDPDPEETVQETVEAVENLEETVEGAGDDVEGTVGGLEGEATNQTSQAEEVIEPVAEELQENFVDPFGAIVILGEGDDHVDGDGDPVAVNVPGVGAVGSLFPRAPLLVLAQGGDNTYESFPRTVAAEETVQTTGEPILSDEDVQDLFPGDPRNPVPLEPPLLGDVGTLPNFFAGAVYESAVLFAEGVHGVELVVTADTPMQAVMDLDGDDTYTGERGAAYAAGGGTAAVYDAGGDDVFDVERGVGLIEEDGLAIVKSFGGNDTVRAERGVGSAIQPFTVNDEGRASFDERFRYRVGGLGAYVNFAGENTYDVGEVGIGVGFQESIPVEMYGVPLTVPVALDLDKATEGFNPVVLEADIEPSTELAKGEDGDGYVRAWTVTSDGARGQAAFETSTPMDVLDGASIKAMAVDRTYAMDLAEATGGTVHVESHDVTLETADLTNFGFSTSGSNTGTILIGPVDGVGAELDLHNEILVHLDDTPRAYEPPYPMILIDAGDSDDTYHDVGPHKMIANSTAPSEGFFEDDVTLAPTLVLDTRGNDRYVGDTASLNTTRLAQELRSTLPAAGSILADLDGDDVFEGDVATVDVNMTLPSSVMTSLVHTAGGSNTFSGGQVGGITATHAVAAGGFSPQADSIGHTITSLLLVGSQDAATERNTFNVDAGSLGSVMAQEQEPDNTGCTDEPDNTGCMDEHTRLLAASAVAAPSDFTSSDHSLGSVYWCEDARRCPGIEPADVSMDGQRPQIMALFVGGNGANTYTLESPDAIGHVTLDPDVDLCTPTETTLTQSRVSEGAPSILTRFVDVGGSNVYQMTDRTEPLPPWRNDDTWRPVEADTDECPPTQVGHNSIGYHQPSETAGGDVATVQTVDTFAIDNLGQYVLGTTGGTATGQVEQQTGLAFEPVRLCAAPFAVMEGGSTLRGFDQPEHRCASGDAASRLSQDAIDDQERLLVTTETRSSVPANAFGSLNPCDAGQGGDGLLDLDARGENIPAGNPIAQGTSGCWALLEVQKQEDSPTTSPIWDRFAPTGDGWLSLLAAPVKCGYTDDRSMPVKCATDAFPIPYHVDGSGGHNIDRWFLPEGTYDYRVTLNGPISVLVGEEATLEGQLRIDRNPLAEQATVPGYDIPVETTAPEGLLAWLEDPNATLEAPSALEGFNVRVLHQDDVGAPEEIEVWSPFIMTRHLDLVPVACLDGTPYRGDVREATLGWHGDRGYWVTTYPLELWEEDEPMPEGCQDVHDPATLDVKGEPIPVDTGLYLAPFGQEPQRLDLPDEALTRTVVVDDVDPTVTLTPVHGPDGDPIKELDADALGTPGLGIADLRSPIIEGHFSKSDLNNDIHIEVPFNVISQSPMTQISFAGVTDDPRTANTIHHQRDTLIQEGIEIVYEDEDEDGNSVERSIPCSPADREEGIACHVRLNHTRSGQTDEGTWYRHAGLNITLEPASVDEDDDPTTDAEHVYRALHRSITHNENVRFEVLDHDEIVAEDEAGNELSYGLDEIVLDLSRPSDLTVPCDADGLQVISQEDTVRVRTFLPEEDIEGLLIERKTQGAWTVQDWVRHDTDTMQRVDRHCQPDASGQWLAFDYTAQDAMEGTTERHELRTVPVDDAGNRGLSFGPFEFVFTVDKRAPELGLRQTDATPDTAIVNITADEPVTLAPEVTLESPEGDEHAPLFVPTERDTTHELVFEGLEVNATYTLDLEALDEATNPTTRTMTVTTARTLNVSLAPMPSVAGERTEIAFTAGALGPTEDGDPMTRIQTEAISGDEVCSAPRALTQYIGAPIDDPEAFAMPMPLSGCPGGELTLRLTIENGPPGDPIEHITLETTIMRDVEPPTPTLDVQGEESETGWYTSPVSIHATGEDDTGIEKARIHTEHGPVSQLTLDTPGVHELNVTAVDLANRSTTTTLKVPIDLNPPRVELVSQDPLPTERSTITVQVLGADDASGLQSIRTLQADGSYTEWSPVFENMQLRLDIQGLDEIVADVRDRAGHVTQTVLPVTSLADPPRVEDGGLNVASPSSIEVHAILDRPLALEATGEQGERAPQEATSAPSTEHRFTLDGLVPSTEVTVTVRAHLSDGSTAKLDALSGTLTLPASQGPPTVPENLSAALLSDGTVKVTWDSARDDAGIDRYLIERRTDGQLTDQRSITNTQILDDPPIGSTHEYRVQAVDLTGRTGEWTAPVTITPTLPLNIVSYEITPEIASAGSPVEVTVTATGDTAPSTAHITYGDEEIPLALEDASNGRWVYAANVTLPATDTFFPKGIQIHMDEQTYPEEGTFPGPVVKALEDDALTTDDVPAPSLITLLIVGTLAAATRRWAA